MKHISILRLLAGGLIFTTASCSLDYDPCASSVIGTTLSTPNGL